MTRLSKLTLFLVSIAVGACLAATMDDPSPLFVFLLTLAACALALGVAMILDDILWRREASYERWRRQWGNDRYARTKGPK